MRKNKGFTLVEILIVVVILGILAAIVIPQFTDASTQSKISSCQSSLQSLRSQIELYKIQHNDIAPAIGTFEAQMTTYSDAAGNTNATKTAVFAYGPYIQMIPINPWNDQVGVEAAESATSGWIYDPDTSGDGDIWISTTGAPAAVVTELQTAGSAL
jgi:general secretion pathway protein G